MLQNWITFLLMTCLLAGASNSWLIRDRSDSYASDTYEAEPIDDDDLIRLDEPSEPSRGHLRIRKSVSEEKRKLCGTMLYIALSSVCPTNRDKRSAPGLLSALTRPSYPTIMDYDTMDLTTSMVDPLASLQQKKMFRSFQKRRGVSDLCCKESCSMRELRRFCPN